MATILSQSAVCDGYDVRVALSDGTTTVVHFAAAPADSQSAVDAFEENYLAAIAATQPDVQPEA